MRAWLKAALALLVCGALLWNFALPTPVCEESPGPGAGAQGGDIALYICPEDRCAEKMVGFIGSARESVHVMIYSFTKGEIAEALVEAEERGLDVRVVMDRGQAASAYSKDEFLAGSGVQVRLADPAGYAVMHHKVAIIDGNAFSAGSFNYSENADTGSAENLLIIHNKALAQKMEHEFESLWKHPMPGQE